MPEHPFDLDPQIIFGDLLTRLNSIRNSTFDYLGLYHPPHQMRSINQEGIKIKTRVALSYLKFSISLVHDIQTNIDEILEKMTFEEEKKARRRMV